MSIINSYSDWGKLEEIILGSPENLTLPDLDISSRHFFDLQADFPQENNAESVIAKVKHEMEEDFQDLTAVLQRFGVTVRRPEAIKLDAECVSPHWKSQQSHALMPRDCLLALGDTLIEAPMPSRNRYFESQSFRNIARDYFSKGAKWIAAPKPVLTDDTYLWDDDVPYLAENDPLFDAANILRCGKDVFFNISNSGNRAGFEWLERTFGDKFNFHPMSICSDHVGTTLQLLRPGLALVNASRMTVADIPPQLRNWELVFFNEPVDIGYAFDWARASVWISMNVLSIDEKTVIVEKNQHKLAEQLDRCGMEIITASFRHGRTVGGGFHCCSLDIRRQGGAESYV
ncbi:inosamine-phosphate amidinotransferase 1 [Salmonella enterica subsp. enterica serovar Muenchen]|nr:inosamine-phosphate amidinotransferase 1 [Salmonella enterica subsp. enterica serovar Muenchen]